ncbi:DUF2511 domain-containing protein [Thermoleophilia bacterium SCSIO 60948]|nr:DUF2511 domain-containing protein [Thermoleophilia bacterium SCSIO 60948]
MIARAAVAALSVLLALCLAACADEDGVDQSPDVPDPPPSEVVSEADLGESWPLIPSEATVSCVGGGDGAKLAIEADGITYGLDEAGERTYAPISPILAGDPADPASREALEPLAEIARQLCE